MAPPPSIEEENGGPTTCSTTTPSPPSSLLVVPTLTRDQAEAAIGRFQSFLQYETVSALAVETGAYKACASFLVDQLHELSSVLDGIHLLPEAPDRSPVVVARWKGRAPDLPAVLWNSHYDVVPADAADWAVAPPFEGRRIADDTHDNGTKKKIYGRGTQDMKCVCMQYIEAIRHVVATDPEWKPIRTLYLTFVPDEEVGGSGMAAFLESSLYKDTIVKQCGGIALALDEGLASTTNTFSVFYGERLPWWVDVVATGPTGHGSRFIEHTAVEQLIELSQKALAFRQGQKDLLGMKEHENCTHAVVAAAAAAANSHKTTTTKTKTLGDVTSLNITSLQAGVYAGSSVTYNCVPPTARATLDIRISPHVSPSDIGTMLDQWCQECSKDPTNGSQITWSYKKDDGVDNNGNQMQSHATTNIHDETVNPWYRVFAKTFDNMNMSLEPQVFPAATDSRFLRCLGIRALGFSPMRNTEILLHENDEYILEENFLEGIGIYVRLLQALTSQGRELEGELPPTK